MPRVIQTKFPATSMVFRVVSSEGDIMPPHFFPEGLKLNTNGYICILNKAVKPWFDHLAAGRQYKNQCPAIPVVRPSKTQAWLSENFVNHISPDIWPPSLCDFFVWNAVE